MNRPLTSVSKSIIGIPLPFLHDGRALVRRNFSFDMMIDRMKRAIEQAALPGGASLPIKSGQSKGPDEIR